MHKKINYYLQILLLLFDLLSLNFIFIITLFVFDRSISFKYFYPYLPYWFYQNLFWIILTGSLRLYSESTIIKFETFTKRTVQIILLWIILNLCFLVFSRQINYSRLFIFLSMCNFALVLVLNRFLYFGFKNYITLHSKLVNKVIILGYNETAKKLARYFEEDEFHTQLLGFVEDEINMNEVTHYPVLAGINNLIHVAESLKVQEIYSTLTPEQNKYIYTLMNDAEDKCMRFKVVPNLSLFLKKPVVIDYIMDMPILSLRSDPLEDIGNRMKKRILDVVVSLFVITFILSWMMPLLGLLIKLESKGPIFFSQSRTGRRDIPFKCLKFRSMCTNNETESIQATRGDLRVTRIGSFLRRSSLDEFPQFVNVLLGNMSLVGPRPHMLKHTADFTKLVDHYMVRQFLKPGITGWAQINSFRGEIINPEQLHMRIASDLWYLENWTIWLDLRIIFLTIYQVFKGDKNAY
jgi:putative colanic acid biosynthesis UDP-glucose lipid carrier transferase